MYIHFEISMNTHDYKMDEDAEALQDGDASVSFMFGCIVGNLRAHERVFLRVRILEWRPFSDLERLDHSAGGKSGVLFETICIRRGGTVRSPDMAYPAFDRNHVRVPGLKAICKVWSTCAERNKEMDENE